MGKSIERIKKRFPRQIAEGWIRSLRNWSKVSFQLPDRSRIRDILYRLIGKKPHTDRRDHEIVIDQIEGPLVTGLSG